MKRWSRFCGLDQTKHCLTELIQHPRLPLSPHSHSPVAVVRVHAGAPVEAGVAGVGGAHAVAELPGGAAAHGRGRHLHRHQGQSARVHQGGGLAHAQLRGAAARPPAVAARALVHLHLAHVEAQLRLELQGRRGEDAEASVSSVGRITVLQV